MTEGIGVVGLYVHDQDEALEFYVGKLGFFTCSCCRICPSGARERERNDKIRRKL